jgi:cytochrome b6-f complex iron-sulfur subunit
MTSSSQAAPSRLDPEPSPRRDFLGKAAIGSALGALGLATLGMLRLPNAAVVAAGSKKFRIKLPEGLAEDEAFVPPGRNVAVFRDAEGVFAISTVCTHLGCIVNATATGFECPCHGSDFAADGTVKKGPAPKALPWLKVESQGSEYVVDEETTVPTGTKV